jgi:nicotinate-nucleotide adenylyltransferase
MARIGLFGGTFNPIHRGHLDVARQLRRRFPLDRVYLIPSRQPPHKSRRELAPAKHRLAMIKLALTPADADGLCLSDLELRREGPSYTVDTVDAFRKEMGPGDALFLIMGADAFLELDLWRHWRTLLTRISFIVMSRPCSQEDGAASQDWPNMAAYAKTHLDGAYELQDDPWRLVHPQRPTIYLAGVPEWEVSSSQVRRRLRKGEGIRDLVPGAVAAYIEAKGLYQ